VSRKRNTRYPHAFSKGQGVRLSLPGTWRPQAPCALQATALGAGGVELRQKVGAPTPELKHGGGSVSGTAPKQRNGSPMTLTYPIALDPRRWKALKVSPTVATLYKGHQGMAVICASCLHGIAHRNPGLPDRFRRQWHLTLLELERKHRCEMCGERNARIYPWTGDDGADLGLQGPPAAIRA
jgi:hypothetical protein